MISKVFMFKLQPIMRVLPAINICYNFSQAWDFLALQSPNNKNPHLFATKQQKPGGKEHVPRRRRTSFSLNPGNPNLQWYEEAKPKGSNTSEFGYLSKPGLLTGGTMVVVSFQYTETWEACAVCAIYLLNTSYCLHSDRWKSQRTLKCAKLDRSIVKLLLFWADTAVLLASRSWCLRTV